MATRASFPAIALLCLLAAGSPARAQSTRAEAIGAEQAQKAKAVKAEGPNKAEQIVVRVISSPLMAGRTGPYPWFGSIFGGSGFSAGAGYFNKFPWGGSINVTAAMSINYTKMIDLRLALPELARGMIKFDTTVRRMDVMDVKYYGKGQDSQPNQRVHYNYQPDEMGLNGSFMPKRWITFTGGLARVGVDTEFRGAVSNEGVRPRDQFAPGIGESLTYSVQRAGVAIDWRDAPGYSTRGGYYQLTYERHAESNGKPYSFHTTEVEVVQLLPLVKEQFVLAFRGLVTYSASDRLHTTPVILSPYLGSGSTLRGFPSRRFTDRNRALLTGEYRWRPSRYLDMALFMDTGQVFSTRRQFDMANWDHTFGAGLRIHGPTFTAVRMEAAKSREGWRLVFATGQPF